ncbi:hypothetical protein ACH5RR_009784 [Cinchona calisaya]|uniref:Uncharacterized protein n=1 Tax=Cinchona calisaya TaxID=153742 RepID=A0ABD3AI12_9GENT
MMECFLWRRNEQEFVKMETTLVLQAAITNLLAPVSSFRVASMSSSNDEIVEYASLKDAHGHGSGTHTASTDAGTPVPLASALGSGAGEGRGMAGKFLRLCQRAHYSSDLLAAMGIAIRDGVNVLSLSLGGIPSAERKLEVVHITEKGQVVKNSGGATMILTNTAINLEEDSVDVHILPATLISFDESNGAAVWSLVYRLSENSWSRTDYFRRYESVMEILLLNNLVLVEDALLYTNLVLKDEIVVYDFAGQRIGWANYDFKFLFVLEHLSTCSFDLICRGKAEKTMVINLEFIRAIIIAEEVLLLDPLRQEFLPFVD